MKKIEIDPAHQQRRSVLRIAGPVVLVAGLLFLAVALIDFFRAMAGHGEPGLFWCAFAGMPMMFVGIVLSSAGFIGSVQRYLAGESAPVAKDTFNYLAEGTQEGVKTVATAVGAGLSEGMATGGEKVRCHKCNEANESDAKFCHECGAALLKTTPCPDCGELNDPDARFCDACGTALKATS